MSTAEDRDLPLQEIVISHDLLTRLLHKTQLLCRWSGTSH